jgi:hypothetical protein
MSPAGRAHATALHSPPRRTHTKPDWGEETNRQTGQGNDAAESQDDDQTLLADGAN